MTDYFVCDECYQPHKIDDKHKSGDKTVCYECYIELETK